VLFASAALSCIFGILAGGAASAFYSSESRHSFLGFTFSQLQPLHTMLVTCWIYLMGICVVYFYLTDNNKNKLSKQFVLRANIGTKLWIVSGISAIVMILLGQFSGREYLPFHPVISLAILVGWGLFAINYFSCIKNFLQQPTFVWMWGVSIILFIWTFIEAHLYLLPAVAKNPLFDISVQWKSYGPLVGSFNLLVYGTVMYISSEIRGCKKYAYSKIGFMLFLVGVTNSFTNFGHHTYHLPQSHYVKWIAFVISMTEILILFKVLWDIVGLPKSWQVKTKFRPTTLLFSFATLWTGLQLIVAIVISIPPINAFIHGTHIVTAHAMGTMIGIDSMILWGAGFYLIEKFYPEFKLKTHNRIAVPCIIAVNVLLLAFWLAIILRGIGFGFERYTGVGNYWIGYMNRYYGIFLSTFGTGLIVSIIAMLSPWLAIFSSGRLFKGERLVKDPSLRSG
jgi:nitric oxide reductase subunit B